MRARAASMRAGASARPVSASSMPNRLNSVHSTGSHSALRARTEVV